MQQINLYQFLPQPVKSFLTGRIMLLLWGVFLSALIISYFYHATDRHLTRQKLDEVTEEANNARKNLAVIVAKYPQVSAVSASSTPEDLLCKVRFSLYLEQLAEIIVPGVWLTDISIAANGKQIRLRGHALKADQVQQFLDNLKNEPIFASLPFEMQDLTKITEKSTDLKTTNEFLNFSLITKA